MIFANGENAVRRIDPAGIITTIAGNAGPFGYGGDNGPATRARFRRPWYTAVGPNGHIYVADAGNLRLRRIRPLLPGYTNEDILITSGDGSELYVFDPAGRHLKTLSTVTGATLYEFTYDAQGRLASVKDIDNNVTGIERDASGNPIAFVGPYGARTTFALDAGGYLAGVTNPAGETTAFEYTSQGLMTKRTSPRGFSSTFTYDAAGRLIKDEDAVGGFQALERADLEDGYQVTRTSATGETATYRVEDLSTGEKKSTYVDSCCGTSEVLVKTDSSLASTLADGTASTMVLGPDPRFGMESPIIASSTTRTPGGLMRQTTMTRAVTLSNNLDPLSLVSMTETMTVNGRAYTTVYDAVTHTRTDSSPAGRQTVAVTDVLGRPRRVTIAGLDPVELAYDGRGRLASMTAGSAGAERTFILGYDPAGRLSSVTDPLSRTTGFEYDDADRLLVQTLPDGRTISHSYDADGNLASITPPGRPAHTFNFNAVELLQQYAPPPLGAGTWTTTYTYDLDRRPTAINRPDGQVVSFAYSPEGKLRTITTPGGDYSFAYNSTSRHVESIVAPDGGTLAFTYDGGLLLSESWTGDVAGGSTGRSTAISASSRGV